MPRQEQLGVWAVAEQRVQVSALRFRVPDICVMPSEPPNQIFHEPPHICIEVLSKDDSVAGMQERMDDYLAFRVRHVWLIDPTKRRPWTYTSDGSIEAQVGVLRATNPDVVLPLADEISPHMFYGPVAHVASLHSTMSAVCNFLMQEWDFALGIARNWTECERRSAIQGRACASGGGR